MEEYINITNIEYPVGGLAVQSQPIVKVLTEEEFEQIKRNNGFYDSTNTDSENILWEDTPIYDIQELILANSLNNYNTIRFYIIERNTLNENYCEIDVNYIINNLNQNPNVIFTISNESNNSISFTINETYKIISIISINNITSINNTQNIGISKITGVITNN